MDLTPYNGTSQGWILDGVVQEIDITSGKAIWTWKSSEHVDPGDCYYPVGDFGKESGGNAWDYFHTNSVEKDGFGNYLISSRHCNAVYYLAGSDGRVIWRLGGQNSSFSMGQGTQFSFQHDARWISLTETNGRMSLFDNAGMFGVYNEDSARGLLIDLDFQAMTATLVQDYLPWDRTVSESQGSMQVQPNGDVLIGQVSFAALKDPEYAASGEMLWTAQFGVDTQVSGYRALRYNWTGNPATIPSIELVQGKSSMLSIYASWNGATEINKWELLGSSDTNGSGAVSLYNRTKTGFETTITISTSLEKYDDYTHFAMRAIDRSGQPLGTSHYVSLSSAGGLSTGSNGNNGSSIISSFHRTMPAWGNTGQQSMTLRRQAKVFVRDLKKDTGSASFSGMTGRLLRLVAEV
ncbi:hypothetical protein VNI00_006781 [Paramarasmius palmivorus]|uniref:Uncharacterized protein n=1 Tax=Paramarasmius palmivorus TaxID=297713 RepID=A0AAW0D4P0_9AGAR